MPDYGQFRIPGTDATTTATPDYGTMRIPTEDAPAETPEGFPWGKAIVGAGALAGAAMLARRLPGMGSTIEGVNSARQQSMLSGLAPVKSFLGNVGAAVEQSALRRSLDPLKEFLSPQTLRDAISEYKANSVPPGITKFPDWLPTPGRVMQSLDTATQNALGRAGLSNKEAQSAVMQAPLPAKLQKALDSPMARYLIPFRRTPFNQFIEGFSRFGEGFDPVVTPAYMATGALHGHATAHEDRPLSVPLAIAASATHGVPYAIGALAGRVLTPGGSGPDSQTVSSMLPVSEYGLSQSVEDPFAPFTQPAALKALKTLTGR